MSDLADLQGLPASPDAEQLRQYSARIADWLVHDFTMLGERPVGATASRSHMESLLREPIPEDGIGFDGVFDIFKSNVAPYALRPGHPRFLAFIPSAPNYFSVLGDWLCAGLNLFAGVWLEAAGATQVELVVLDWFKELLGLPPTAGGILTGGGSEANLTALLAARESLAFTDRSRAVLYVTRHRHWSVDRAVKVMGLRPEQVCPVAAGNNFRLIPAALNEAVVRDRPAGKVPWAVVVNAGATSTGTVDPLEEVAEICRQHGLWLHVDAAYGWPAVLIQEGKALLRGIERADSITLDPHKWFAQTFEAGCVLVRDGRRLHETFAHSAEYMQDVQPAEDEVNFSDLGLALSRRFRALKIWFSVKVLGMGWFRALVQHSCDLANLAESALLETGRFEMMSPRELSIVCFRYRPGRGRRNTKEETFDRFNLELCKAVRDSGMAFLSSTRLHDRVALRFCFVNWRTTAEDVKQVVQLLTSLGEELENTFEDV